jgi:rhodanese-related sulfurtransferase
MKFFLDNWLLITVAFASGALLVWPAVGRGMRAGGLSPSGAVQLINREKAVVVDVCEDAEYAAGHIVNARHVPLGQLEQRLPEVVKNKAVPLILVCASGARAQRAAAIAQKLGYQKAQVLGGGMAAWKEANLPVEKNA